MKKLTVLATFILSCLSVWGLAQENDLPRIRTQIGDLRTSLNNLDQLSKKYSGRASEENKYIKDAQVLWNKFRNEVASLENKTNSYLSKSGAEGGDGIVDALGKLKTEVAAANKRINLQNIPAGQLTTAIQDASFKLIEALNEVSNSIPSLIDSPPDESPTPKPTPKPSPTSTRGGASQPETADLVSTLISYIPFFLVGLFLVCGVGGVFWFLYRLHGRLAAVEQALSVQNQDDANVHHLVEQGLESLRGEYEQQRHLDQQRQQHQQKEFSRLKTEIEWLQKGAQPVKPRSAAPEPSFSRQREEPPTDRQADRMARAPAVAAPKITSAAEYLNRAGGNAVRAKAVKFRPEVLQQDEEGPYVLMPEDGDRNSYKVIPFVPRFQSSQDYSHFSYFYECDQPSSGEVLIVEPALATYDDSARQWTLRHTGRLQIV